MFCSTASINKLHECHLELYLFIYYLFIYLFIYLFSLYLTLTKYRKQKNTCLQ